MDELLLISRPGCPSWRIVEFFAESVKRLEKMLHLMLRQANACVSHAELNGLVAHFQYQFDESSDRLYLMALLSKLRTSLQAGFVCSNHQGECWRF